MSRKSFWAAITLTFVCGLAVGYGVARDGQAAYAREMLPRYTEEREAAALYFVKKNLPELAAVLVKLKQTAQDKYQTEIREIYHATELLSDLSDDPQRQDLELKVWIAENKAQVLIAKLSTPQDAERKKITAQVQDLAKELVKLDIDIVDLRAEQLERELAEVREEGSRLRTGRDKMIQERFESLIQRVAKRGK